MNLPNLITIFRIVAAFIFLFFGIQNRWEVAFPVFVVAALSDMIDGMIAKLFRQRTQLGGFLDPLADKLLMLFGFITLTKAHILPLGLTLLVIARDVLIASGILALKIKKIPILFKPTYLSKLTTFFQILTILSGLLLTQALAVFRETVYGRVSLRCWPVILAATGLLTFLTALQYIRIGTKMLPHEKN